MDRIYATWRNQWVQKLSSETDISCPFCSIEQNGMSNPDIDVKNYVVKRQKTCFAVLNLYPYGTGHLLVIPSRHVADLSDLSNDERADLFELLRKSIEVVKLTYAPDGINFGANLGRSAGAGIPDHFHMHILPRWTGDSGFITTISETRVISESLEQTLEKLSNNWDKVN